MEDKTEVNAEARVIPVDNLEDERLRPYRNLKERTLRGESVFIAEGALVVERLLQSRYEVESVLITSRNGLECRLELVPESVPIYMLDENVAANELLGFKFSKGTLAAGRRSPAPTALEGFARFFTGQGERPRDKRFFGSSRERRAWVVLPDATKPENMGLAFRCAAALDAEAVVLGERCCDPFSRRALRTSMGGVLQVPIYRAKNLYEEIKEIRDRWGVCFSAAVLDDRAISSYEIRSKSCVEKQREAFVFGNEYYGLSPEMIELCDRRVMIPMRCDVDSLNLGVSVGVFLYEFNRASSLL